jgi:hypothetical protein
MKTQVAMPMRLRQALEIRGHGGAEMIRWQSAAILCVVTTAPLYGGAEGELQTGTFNASELCGECHEEIHAMWKRSMHSAAFSDPIFQASFMRAYWETRGEAQQVCLRCHAPVAALTDDLTLSNPVSSEGITCDFCHSVVAVNLERNDQPFEIANDGVKRGPLADAESPVHGVAKSKLHESAELCAGCHEWNNKAGVPILTTYSEWKASPQAAEGKTCQHCHMPLTPGETVRSGLTDLPRESINLHNISGMHSVEQVRKAATARIVAIRKRNSNTAVVEVQVANVGSGHSIPTGMPTRRLVLEVVLYAGDREIRRFERVYQKTLVDEFGQLLVEDHRALLEAHRIQDDTRLRPGERRLERFVSIVPQGESIRVEARLHYVYEPRLLTRETIQIEITSDGASSPR